MSNVIFDFDYTKACVTSEQVKKIGLQLIPEIQQIKHVLPKKYETDYASLHVPYDTPMLNTVLQLIDEKKKLCISTLVVIGIGGSNLGTIAVHKALCGDFHNKKDPAIKVYFADTVDSDYLCDLLCLVEKDLCVGQNVLINVVTKSGTTTETIANFEMFFDLLKKYKPETYSNYIVITTDKGSLLWNYAQKHTIDCLDIPTKVGGRYSVFSPVGLFPLGFLGVNLKKLLVGARSMLQECLKEDIEKNTAAMSAAIQYIHYKNGANIHDIFVFSKYLRSFAQWCRQLIGESVGKKFNKAGKEVAVGVTPTVSVGTVDLHSVAQLYLGGPQDKFTTFISVAPKCNLFLPEIKAFDEIIENIQGKSVSSIMNSIVGGVKAAYVGDKRPFVSVYVPMVEEICLGKLMQWKMLEIMYLGYLLHVNPFDQPQVELYKKETRKLLKK